jgi:hypothetical protein
MRPVEQWDESDLLSLIADGVQESLHLDYKASDALQRTDGKKNEISKDVSAFANSDGGMLVYGIEEIGHLPVKIDNGCDPAVITREWLGQVINSTISPRIGDVRIRQITLANGRFAFAVEVPKAQGAGPHQASDKRYYKRFEYESVAMYDYEVRDIMRRATTPELELGWELVRASPAARGTDFLFNLRMWNHSSEIAQHVVCTISVDQDLTPGSIELFTREVGAFQMGGRDHPSVRFSRIFSPIDHVPFYREQPFRIGQLPVNAEPNKLYYMKVIITCPGFARTRWAHFQVSSNGEPMFRWFDSPDGDAA